MKKITYLVITFAITAVLLVGCQESDSQLVNRARLVGNENLQLKKQLAQKDKEIEDLKKEIERIEMERAEEREESGEATIKSMRLVLENQKQIEKLTAENEALKEQLKQLQGN